MSKTASTKFLVDITSAGGDFEISEGGMTVCTGKIYIPDDLEKIELPPSLIDDVKDLPLNSADIYKELKLRGYDYGPTFRGVAASNLHGDHGLLKWTNDWVVFLDTMLQFSILGSSQRALRLPTRIQSLKIDPVLHSSVLESTVDKLGGIPIYHDKHASRCISGGVVLKNLKATFAPKNAGKQIPVLEEYHFVPNHQTNVLSKEDTDVLGRYVNVCSSVSRMILELSGKSKAEIAKVMDDFEEADDGLIASYLKSYTDSHALLKTLCGIMNAATSKDLSEHVKNYMVGYLEDRNNDVLSQPMQKESPLRTLVDIFLENATSRKLKIAELCDNPSPLTKNIHEFIQTLGMVNISYTVAHTDPSRVEEDYLPSGHFNLKSWDPKAATTDLENVDLLVMKYLNVSAENQAVILKNAVASLKDNGFVVLLQRTRLVPAEMFLSAVGGVSVPVHHEADLEQTFTNLNLSMVCKKSDSLASTLYLLKKTPPATDYKDTVIAVPEQQYSSWVDQLKEKMIEAQTEVNSRIWLVSHGSNSNGVCGLVNCLKQEPGGASIRCVLTGESSVKVPVFSVKDKFYKDVVERNLVMNVFKNDTWGSYRHLKMSDDRETVSTRHSYLNVLTKGDLSSLVWVDSDLKYFKQAADSTICEVYYAPLNFRDIMLASGKLPPDAIPGSLVLQDCILGLEFSGRLPTGKRVMGVLSSKALATTVPTDLKFLWEVPDHWSLEEASTVPVAYSTAYYALVCRGNMRPGERVLIHSGSGGVGQAAIAIALGMGCEVYTSVGSSEKREFLKNRFPALKDKNFCNSRDTSFEQYILNATNGEGVDVILNSLADDKMKATLNCLADHGRFLEIGKYDLSNNTPLGMSIFLKNISFHGILLDALFENNAYSVRTKSQVVKLVNDGIADGTVKPLPSILFDHDQAEQAFRFMASGRHIGKVVLKIREEEPDRQSLPTPVTFNAITRTHCNPESVYVIIGGLGGFGLELAQWLTERGAKKIVLTSRSGLKSGYQKLSVDRWTNEGVKVEVSKLDASKRKDAEELLKLAAKMGPVGGIFNLALVLRDAFMENQTVINFIEVCESKVSSTHHLDELSRRLCPGLEWFVCFSSISCGRGNAGQSNYGYANSVMERICEERSKAGLPGLAIQWGAIGDVGVLEDTVGYDAVIGGTLRQRILSCLSVLDKFLQQAHPVVSSFVPYQPSESGSAKTQKCNVLSTVANIFGIKDMSTINPETSLGELGMDSLMGVEVKQFLERDFDLVLGIPELRQLKIKDLKKLEGGASSSAAEESKPPVAGEQPSNPPGNFVNLSSEQLVPHKTVVPMNSVSTGPPLFVVHPIEGTVAMLDQLAKNLAMPVYGVQCTPEAPGESVEKLAAYYWKSIITYNNLGSKGVYLSGYSFGAAVAFEMSLQAERDPKTHPKVLKLALLDGSPALVTSYTREHESHFQKDSQVEGEAQALASFVMQFANLDMRELKTELLTLPTFADRIALATQKISATHPSLQRDHLSTAFDLYYKKLLISLKYTPKYKLKRDVVLIKASDSVDMTKTFSEQYDLEKVCDGKISMHTVKGTHNSFIQDKGAKEVSNLLSDIFAN